MIIIHASLDAHGALLDGTAHGDVRRFMVHIEDYLAEEAISRIRAYLPTQYMYLGHNGGTPYYNPVPPNAGFYQTQIHSTRLDVDSVMVTDTPVVYGPWLEGVSSKNLVIWPHRFNPPPRRFPGYHTFRIIGQQLNSEAGAIAEREFQPFMEMIRS